MLEDDSYSIVQRDSKEQNQTITKTIMTSIKWNIGNSILGAVSLVIAIIALSRTVESMMIVPDEISNMHQSTTTDLIEYDHELHKRFPWFVIGWVFGVANFGALLYGLASSCNDFSQSTGDKFSCIYGAIGTAVTIAGAGWTAWNKYIEIGNALLNASKKRDVELIRKRDELANELAELFRNNTGLAAEFVGHHEVKRVKLVGNLNITTSLYMPTIRFTTPHNDSFHFAIERRNDYSFSSVLGMKASTDVASTKREDFNEEKFSKGGVEFTHYYEAKDDGDNGVLRQDDDWQAVYDQTKCKALKDIMAVHERDYVQYQIYDHNNDGTIAAGTIVGFSDQPEGFHGINEEPYGLPEDDNCAVN